MHCPNCDLKLEKVVAKSHYGVDVELNQCPGCGGVWCDDLEMHRVSPKSARSLGKLNAKKLQKLVPIKKKLVCPRCRGPLKEFKDPYFPKQIKLEHCFSCGGFWLNRGELLQFKDWQKKKAEITEQGTVKIDKELEAQMGKILDLHKNKTIQTWGKVGKFLNQSANSPQSNSDVSKTMGYIGAVFQILCQIVRVLMK